MRVGRNGKEDMLPPSQFPVCISTTKRHFNYILRGAAARGMTVVRSKQPKYKAISNSYIQTV